MYNKEKIKYIVIIFLLFSFNISFAENPLDYIGKDFKPQCYEYYKKLDRKLFIKDKVYKLQLHKKIDVIIEGSKLLLPYKNYKTNDKYIDYKTDFTDNFDYLNDNNNKTFIELDTKKSKEIILEFEKGLEISTFDFNLLYFSSSYRPKYFISEDSINYSEVSITDMLDFPLRFLKIKFVSQTKSNLREKIKIYELSFKDTTYTYLVNNFYGGDIEVYSTNKCKDNNYMKYLSDYGDFSIDKNTETIKIYLEKNYKYNVYTKFDYDNDWVEDKIDNCKNIYNPDQSDTNGDGIGDMCSDDDLDGIIGYYDNCINIANRNQKDINKNGVGDVCEFDKDKDGIFDSLDNCINKPNINQGDKDKDNIGDICDNCELYNPAQLDKNGNGVGDICEEKEKELKENDKDFDKVIDYKDNCKDIANPDQLDSDGDGIGNACDNCKNIQNTRQIDFDENGVGDMCEDSDSDGFLGYLDNCINISNPDQEDDDNDGVGNLCEDEDGDKIFFKEDNCPYDYNPEQKDIDRDNIGDKCDEKDNRYMSSNKPFFIGLLLFFATIFAIGIFFMVKKLEEKKK